MPRPYFGLRSAFADHCFGVGAGPTPGTEMPRKADFQSAQRYVRWS